LLTLFGSFFSDPLIQYGFAACELIPCVLDSGLFGAFKFVFCLFVIW